MNGLADVIRVLPRLCQDTEPVKIHQAGDHQLDKIRPLIFVFFHKFPKTVDRIILFPNKAPVVPCLTQGRTGGFVGDAEFLGHFPGLQANAPFVTAVPKVRKSKFLIVFQGLPDKIGIYLILMPGNGLFPVFPVQDHVNVAVRFHFPHLARSSQKATALAAATFRESTPWYMGIFTV